MNSFFKTHYKTIQFHKDMPIVETKSAAVKTSRLANIRIAL